MAIQPSNRPAGSTQILRYTGAIVRSAQAFGTFPKASGEYPSDAGAGPATTGVRFLLADATNVTNMQRRFPAFVYDDQQPAAACPHEPVDSVPSGTIVGASDQSLAAFTWAQNTYVRVLNKGSNITNVDVGNFRLVLDGGPTSKSGLGLGTGLPVLILPISYTALDGQTADPISFEVEIRHTGSR